MSREIRGAPLLRPDAAVLRGVHRNGTASLDAAAYQRSGQLTPITATRLALTVNIRASTRRRRKRSVETRRKFVEQYAPGGRFIRVCDSEPDERVKNTALEELYNYSSAFYSMKIMVN